MANLNEVFPNYKQPLTENSHQNSHKKLYTKSNTLLPPYLPKVIGKNVDEAVDLLQSNNPNYNVVKKGKHDFVLCVVIYNRIKVKYDENTNLVIEEPIVG